MTPVVTKYMIEGGICVLIIAVVVMALFIKDAVNDIECIRKKTDELEKNYSEMHNELYERVSSLLELSVLTNKRLDSVSKITTSLVHDIARSCLTQDIEDDLK